MASSAPPPKHWHTHSNTHTHLNMHTEKDEQKHVISSRKTLLLAAGTYASAPAPLADREGEGTSAEERTFL